ncbi:thiamine pyrophosphate enzyme, central domain protein (macronuclear) [Tetrahymena thermophila SB210]|uniref:2-hydroxyacyl-CoA lyase n=1 Tax=Tetrahymena thermophila (strain SB210) TaxID=312017 RepID=I7MIT6_TETTS|nr:thiamine pyrophosphate enzyme, central domain protein [Tetrahymena thermophila SB210]EAR94938.3 thiamine pyrophosphate enzyme, central domain protein [Tetrahymena thermophila SB210]|eukprot:XP_001015183.3 thiamine pyrophosphate enzyme, central domain protein [Tetrahymena thermophila SB210]
MSIFFKENSSKQPIFQKKLGYNLLAEALQQQGLEYCFSVENSPVIQLEIALIANEIKNIGFKSQKGAVFAASAIGFMTGRPGICVFGREYDIIQVIEGLTNAWINGWPVIVISACKDIYNQAKGTHQEIDRKAFKKFYIKYSQKVTSVADIPMVIEKAYKMCVSGRAGPVYIEIPGNILDSQVPIQQALEPAIITQAPPVLSSYEDISIAADLLKKAKNPLIVIGPLNHAEEAEIKKLISKIYLPFLPTLFGKGVISDKHNCCVIQAQNYVLQNTDVILLIGTGLNWILDFGQYPQFNRDAQIIQIFNDPEYFNYFIQGTVNLCGNIQDTIRMLYLEMKGFNSRQIQIKWWQTIQQIIHRNEQVNKYLLFEEKQYLSFYSALGEIVNVLPKDFICVIEGDDIKNMARPIINQVKPKQYLSSGNSIIKGVSIPFCIASKCVYKNKPVVCIFDDESFNLSQADIEASSQYKLPFIAIIFNTKKYAGMYKKQSQENKQQNYQFVAHPSIRFEKAADNYGGVGILVNNLKELKQALNQAFKNQGRLYIINILIDQPLNQTEIEQKANYFRNSGINPKL